MKTEESNKLIAEFMGLKFNPTTSIHFPEGTYTDGKIGHCADKGLLYHTSWDWLMPVLKKINHMLIPHDQWRMISTPTEYDIEDVYNQAVQFIQLYNQRGGKS